jgi:TolA-binding protein
MQSHANAYHMGAQPMHRGLMIISAIVVALWLLLGSVRPQAVAQSPDEESLFSIAVQAYQDGLSDLARDQLQMYLATYPRGKHLAEVHYLLGDYFYRKADYTQAAHHLQNALSPQTRGAFRDDARYLLGRSYFETGRYADAAQALHPLLEQGQDARWYEAALYWTGEALLSQGDAQGAIRTLQQLVEQFPASEYLEYALYSLGYTWQKVDVADQSLQAFQQLLQRFPQSKLRPSAEYAVARALVSLQRDAEAAAYWERLKQQAQSPDQAEEATFWWAESWTRAGRCDHARPAFQAYLTHFPQGQRRADALITVGECAQAAGDFAEAIGDFDEFLRQFPADSRRDPLLLRLADAYYQAGQLAKAYEHYSQWLAAFPNSPRRVDVLIRRGLISRTQEDYTQVVQDFDNVLQQTNDPQQQVLAHEMLAESYFKLDNCAAALPHLSAVVEQGAKSAQQQARLRRGMCAYRRNQFAAVVEDFSRLADDADFRGDRPGLLLLLGQSLAALDRDTEAIVRLRQCLATGPSSQTAAQALASLGARLLKTGQVAEALPVYEQLLRVAPDLPDQERLHLQLGLLYREQQIPEQAKMHLQTAVDGRDAAVGAEALYHLSDLLLEEGRQEEGTALLQKLTTQFAAQARWVGIASYRLALIYEEGQQWPEAWKAYMAAAENAVDAKLVEAARERAKHLEETVDVHARQEPASSPGERDL